MFRPPLTHYEDDAVLAALPMHVLRAGHRLSRLPPHRTSHVLPMYCTQVTVSAASLHIVLAHYEEDAAHMASLLTSILHMPAIASMAHEVHTGKGGA